MNTFEGAAPYGKRLIASDYDGTLYVRGAISASDRAAIRAWQKAGGLFGVVTGRGHTIPARIAAQGVACDFFICYNGALILDARETPVYSARMSADAFSALERWFARRGDAQEYSASAGETEYYQYSALMRTCEAAEACAAEINLEFGRDVSAFANGLNINIVRKGENKARGVLNALEYFKLPAHAAAVVGDDLNDLDMIIRLNGWAMASGRAKVVESAPHVCASIADLVYKLNPEALNGV